LIPAVEFKLDGSEYIELKSLLKVAGLCETGGEAKIVITEGKVKVDGIVETRKGCKIRAGRNVEFAGKSVHVID
jgi:ribosome-associated protein